MELKRFILLKMNLATFLIATSLDILFLSIMVLYPLSSLNIIPISDVLIAGTIAFIGFQQALFLSREQTERQYQRKLSLEKAIKKVNELKKQNPSHELLELYNSAEKR